MRRTTAVALASALALAGTALTGSSAAADHHEGPLPPHPHLLVIGAEPDFSLGFPLPTEVRQCVELAAGQELPLRTQHQHVHFATAGHKLATKAGNVIVPAAPFPGVPWSDCESLIAILGLD